MSIPEAEDRMIGYDVVDSDGQKFGSVDNLYLDTDTNNPEFFGVKSGWLSSTIYIVPTAQAEIDDANRTIRLPYMADKIKNAPHLSSDAEVTQNEERTIYDYYGLNRSGMTNLPPTQAQVNMDRATTAPATQAAMNTNRTTEAMGRAENQDEIRVPLTEERLTVGKRAVETGGGRLRKVVRTEHVSVPVELRKEELVVERAAAQGQTPPGDAFQEKVIDVRAMREEPVIQKEAVVTGEAVVRKTAETETRTMEGDVRKEDVVVDNDRRTVDADERTVDADERNRP